MDVVYYGLASANGLESFLKDENNLNTQTKLGNRFGNMIFGEEANAKISSEFENVLGMMAMTARANAHRRNVVYRATMSPDVAEVIEDILSKDPIEALKLLKAGSTKIELARIPHAEKFWNQIPNKDLDPYN